MRPHFIYGHIASHFKLFQRVLTHKIWSNSIPYRPYHERRPEQVTNKQPPTIRLTCKRHNLHYHVLLPHVSLWQVHHHHIVFDLALNQQLVDQELHQVHQCRYDEICVVFLEPCEVDYNDWSVLVVSAANVKCTAALRYEKDTRSLRTSWFYLRGNYDARYRLYSAMASHVGVFFHLFACRYLSLLARSNQGWHSILDSTSFSSSLSSASSSNWSNFWLP